MVYALLAVFGLALAMIALLAASPQRQRFVVPRMPIGTLRSPRAAQLDSLQRSGHFRGVRIETRCRAAMTYAGREFRFADAPLLPVPGCDAAVCECGYVGLPERRAMRDRRSGDDRRKSDRSGSHDRRSGRGRRQAPIAQPA